MSPSLAAEVRKSKGVHYYHPRIPFDIRLPGPLTAGSPIHVHGAVLSSPTRFCINLKDGEGAANVLFHYNPRFDEGVVVRNHFNNQAWGSEERDVENPFVPGCTFLLTIMADGTAYEVKLNGETSVTFQSRDEMPLSSITHLEIKGDVVIYAIIIPTSSMSIPLHLNIPAQIHVGDQIIVSGDVPSDANRFTMNLQCSCDDGSDRVFHFNPRFGDGVIVCNTRCGDQWDEEVREGLMIGPGQPFVWSVGASTEAYHTFLNNQKAVKFSHRLDKSTASVLRVNGDVTVNNVQISCPPNQLPPAMTDSARKFDESAVAVSFCEALPFQLALPGPLQPGQMIVLSCYICPDPTRFTVNLQCGEKCHDRALHFNPRWDDDAGAVTVINSKVNDEWGSEERFENNLEANTYVTVIIYCKNDGYTIAIDDEIIVPLFEHRMDCQSVTHVVVDGSILVQRIFAA